VRRFAWDACKKNAVSIGLVRWASAKATALSTSNAAGLSNPPPPDWCLPQLSRQASTARRTSTGGSSALPDRCRNGVFWRAVSAAAKCMKTCKTNGLQPADLECGFDGLWTRIWFPARAVRRQNATCAATCARRRPSGRSRLPEKQFVKARHGGCGPFPVHCLGNRKNFVSSCAEICPIHAIDSMVVDNFKGRLQASLCD